MLLVVPYYNKPGQAGMVVHFRSIAESVGLPIILYDVPSRTVCGLADETVVRLAEIPQLVGLKDASGDLARPLRLRARLGPDFCLTSGDDRTALAFMAQGGNGCISVTSNVAPGLCRDMYLALQRGHLAQAQQLAMVLERLTTALFRESNPAPVKYALSKLKIMSSRVRLPLVLHVTQTSSEGYGQIYVGFVNWALMVLTLGLAVAEDANPFFVLCPLCRGTRRRVFLVQSRVGILGLLSTCDAASRAVATPPRNAHA